MQAADTFPRLPGYSFKSAINPGDGLYLLFGIAMASYSGDRFRMLGDQRCEIFRKLLPVSTSGSMVAIALRS
jgi:hypothetical protein